MSVREPQARSRHAGGRAYPAAMLDVVPWGEIPEGASLAEQAFYAIREQILTLQIPPGAPLHEDRLCAELGLGRTPVREAVKRLEAERLVVVYPRRGTFATDIDIRDHALIADVRRELESHAARRAAERSTGQDRAALEAVLHELADLQSESFTRLIRLDARAHAAIYRCTHNPYLETTLGQYYNLALRLWYCFTDRLNHVQEHVASHGPLLVAILDRDGQTAHRLAADHVDHFAATVLETELGALVNPRRPT
jgi:DNA-binding GntR family transcriptional regulator